MVLLKVDMQSGTYYQAPNQTLENVRPGPGFMDFRRQLTLRLQPGELQVVSSGTETGKDGQVKQSYSLVALYRR